jgi:iron complex outermembrane receptor protein
MARNALYLGAASVSLMWASTAWAQDALAPAAPAGPATQEPVAAQPADAAADIVVTAQRRSESAQRVPISLTAVSSEQIERASITNVQDLPRIAPGLTAYRATQSANTRLSIRGIGSSGNTAIEPSVGAFVDGIYIARPGSLLAAINDVAGIEVLRGPQGTLFGRNASVGALSFRTNEPTKDFEGQVTAEYGNYDRARLTGVVNLPVSDTIATRFSALYDRYDGYGRNLLDGSRVGGNETASFRGAVRAEVTPDLTWLVRGDYQRQRGDGQAIVTIDAATVTPTAAANFARRLNGLVPRLDGTYSYGVRQNTAGALRDDQWGLSSDLALQAGDFTLRLLSGYRDWRNRQVERDISLTPADLYGRAARYRSKTHSQELQLISPSDLLDDHLSFVAGLYYFREDYSIGSTASFGTGYCNIYIRNVRPASLAACNAGPQSGAADSNFNQITTSYAAYGQATVKLTDRWDVTGGLRYSHDSKDGNIVAAVFNSAAAGIVAPDAASLRFDGGKLTYRANTTFRPIEDVMLFATVSSGYKSGGLDSGTGNTLGTARVFRPETTTNYELGFKTQTLGRKLTVNGTLFRMDIDEFQLRSYNGVFFSVRNAGSIRQQGMEFEVTARPAKDLVLGLAATRLASRYTDFRNAPGLPGFGGTQNLTGARLPFSPKWQGNASIDYRVPSIGGWDVGFNTRLAFTSDIDVGGGGDANPQGIQDGYSLLGARVTLFSPSDRLEFAVAGENLTDQGYCTLKYSQTLAAGLGLNDPATGGTVQRCVLGEPRTVRFSAKLRF